MIVLIDNYDSFTFNLVQYLRELGEEVAVLRNDVAGVDALAALEPSALVVSPGPCDPDRAGISMARTLGAPATVPAGKQARSASSDVSPPARRPSTVETRCMTCE